MDKQKILLIIEKIESLHIEDIKIYDYWDELTVILTKNETETINYLSNCEDTNIIENISSVFEDISIVLQSNEFINCIETLAQKYPDININEMVIAAKNVIMEY